MPEATASDTRDQAAADSQSEQVEVNEAELPEAVDTGARSGGGQIDILMDAMLTVSARLGEARLTIRDLLALAPGAVLELDKQVGEPVELYLRGVPFASGSLVVVGERLAVRIGRIMPSASVDEPADDQAD